MRRRSFSEDFGRIEFFRTGWKNYSHLTGHERAVFAKLMRSPRFAFLRALFLGHFGVHRFYLGQYRLGLAIAGFSILAYSSGSMILFMVAALIVLIEIGNIVRVTEQFNDSLEGALMLKTYSKPLFVSEKR